MPYNKGVCEIIIAKNRNGKTGTQSKILLPSQEPLHKLASMLHNSKYDKIITDEVLLFAKENKLVFVFGYSDDKCVFNGTINIEVPCFRGEKIHFDKNGKNFTNKDGFTFFTNDIDKAPPQPNMIEAVWHENERLYISTEPVSYYQWFFKTNIIHVPFDIIDKNGEPYCRGIIFSQNSLI